MGNLSLKENLVTGLAIRFGSARERDREGQYFDTRTALYLDQYIPGAPVWLSHTYDLPRGRPLKDASPIGEMQSYVVQPGVGVWITTKLTLGQDDPRYRALAADLQAGKMRYSSDSIQHIVNPRIGRDGHIAVWPLAGLSIVYKDLAAEPRLPVLAAKACEAAYQAAWKTVLSQRSQHVLNIQKLLAQAASLLGVKPDAGELIGALKGFKQPQGAAAKMDEAQTQQFDALLSQIAELIGIEPSVEGLMAALQQMQSEAEAGKSEGAAPPAPTPPPAPPAPAPAPAFPVPQVPVPAKSGSLTEADVQRLVVEALAAQSAQAQPAGPPAQEQVPVDPIAIAAQAAKSAVEALAQQQLGAQASQVMPPGSALLGAFSTPADRQPASKSTATFSFLKKRPAGPAGYKTILDAVAQGPDACKAIGLGTGEDGGYVLPEERSQEIIELLYAKEVAMALGADFQVMRTQTLEVPKLTSGSQAFYLADNEEAVESQAKFGQVTLNLKRLTAMTRVSKRWLRYASGPAAENKTKDDLGKAVYLRQDLDVLRGAGAVPSASDSGAAPLGIRWTDGIGIIDGASEVPTLELLEQMVLQLLRNNVDDDGSFGRVMHPAVLARFTNLKNASGEPILRKDWSDQPYATLLGYRYATTTQVPINLGASGKVTSSGNLSEIYFGRFSDVVIGVGQDVTLSTTTERYWEHDQVGIRVDVDWDAKVFRPDAFVVAKSVLPFPTS